MLVFLIFEIVFCVLNRSEERRTASLQLFNKRAIVIHPSVAMYYRPRCVTYARPQNNRLVPRSKKDKQFLPFQHKYCISRMPRGQRLSSFELSDHNLTADLSYSEVKRTKSEEDFGLKDGVPSDKPLVKHSAAWFFTGMIHPEARISKLVTHEDKDHIHKTLGICSLLSFIYRYGYVYPKTGSLGFTGTYMDWVTFLIHTLLAFSSILFRVPSKRIDNKPMVIYEEYRQHAMVFTGRCLAVYACAIMFPDSPRWFVPTVVCVHHMMADRITANHGTGSTAVRAGGDKPGSTVPDYYKKIGLLYSFYQFLAVASHILPNVLLADLAYNAIIAIQSSAFMMTLYRKRIIRGRTHVVVYSSCLFLSAFHICRLIGWTSFFLVLASFATRVNLPRAYSNKYVIWVAFLITHAHQELIWEYVEKATGMIGLSSTLMSH